LSIQNKEQDEQDRLEDVRGILSIITNQQNTMIHLQKTFLQRQQDGFARLEQVIVNKFDQLNLEKSITKDEKGTRDIGLDKSVSPSPASINLFVNDSWSNRYFQYGVWHGPFKHWMTFNVNNNTFEGHGEDNVGQFILSGLFSKENHQIDMIQAYKVYIYLR
jgi:hypothetical protein